MHRVQITVIAVSALLYGCADPDQAPRDDPNAHCYTFSSVGEVSHVVRSTLTGCSNRSEYQWTERRLGYSIDVIHDGPMTRCFEEPLEELGACSSKSLGE